ncbi:MAG TPA: hypothetical protein VF756_25260 [Thermoanaerobaculia bacterium]
MKRSLRILALPLIPLLAACGGGDGDGGSGGPTAPRTTTVQFVYVAATTTDPQVAARFPNCVNGIGRTHIHPSWRGYPVVVLTAAGDRWNITFTDVPVGSENRIRVSDPNVCDENPTGAATQNVFANGVRLTRVVDTPGSGIEPGLAFQVDANGTVTP